MVGTGCQRGSIGMALPLVAAALAPAEGRGNGWMPPNAEVVTREELREGLYGYDLFDVLAALGRRSGITVKSSSDVGAEDWLLVRGLPRDSARNVLVLIDGMPLNDAASEANEFEHLPPIEMIERIVVYKPPLPARFGGYHAAIEIETRREVEAGAAEAAAAYGSRSTTMASVGGEGRRGRLAWIGMLDYLETDNLSGERRTPPRETEVYGDRSYRRLKPAGKVVYGGPLAGVALYGQYVDSTKYFSDEVFRGERERRDRRLAAVNLGGWLAPARDVRVEWNLFRADEEYRLNLRLHPSVRDQRRWKQGGRLSWTWTASPRHRWLLGAEVTERHARERRGRPLRVSGLTTSAVYAEYRGRPADAVTVSLGLRRDVMSGVGRAWNYSVGLAFSAGPDTELYGRWGRTTRWPSLSELSSWDPGLAPTGERLRGAELGVRHRLLDGRGTLRAAVFDLELEDEAKFVMDRSTIPPFFGYRPQPDAVRSRGVELGAELRLTRRWRGFANYTYNRVTREPGGTTVDFGGPARLANLGLRYTDQRMSLDLAARYGGPAKGVQAMGGGPTRLAPWLLVDAALRVRQSERVELFVRGSNLLGTRYETFDGRPMFGRVVVGGIGARW